MTEPASRRRVVAALGGNALLRRGEPVEAERQRHNVARAAQALAEVAADNVLIVTHGNGPQVGLLALQSLALSPERPDPLDVLGAESEGLIGYLLEQELRNQLPGRECATLLTQVLVAADDPAFACPTKPIGPWYAAAEAEELARAFDWRFTVDGSTRRRVVASPVPVAFVEQASIELLVDAGVVVICGGGGGIPVVDDGALRGVEAVVDKDRSAALLARVLRADVLLLLTDVSGVQLDWRTPQARVIRLAHPDELRALDLDEGSMGPKVEAALAFATFGGVAVIGAMEQASALLRGTAGTTVTARARGLECWPTPVDR
jgi:carbamate kinase